MGIRSYCESAGTNIYASNWNIYMLLGFVPMVKVKIKVKVVHILTANIWGMLIDEANITIAIEYDVL